ncbi:MAG: hypothetical protein AMXMBFR20_31830 [Planctomycetia bacterium]|jgi:hypothetical protein
MIASSIVSLLLMLPAQTCPTFEQFEPAPAGDPGTTSITIPVGILPLNDILAALGLPSLVKLESITVPAPGGGGSGGGDNFAPDPTNRHRELHVAVR